MPLQTGHQSIVEYRIKKADKASADIILYIFNQGLINKEQIFEMFKNSLNLEIIPYLFQNGCFSTDEDKDTVLDIIV